ncbi:hypothetical protein HanPI659440_Chr00c06g0716921 [Helianthus annuus]|nr:hypothetical protein HanPI659440_Chr00c06g0716921 [Helianthus annuus]
MLVNMMKSHVGIKNNVTCWFFSTNRMFKSEFAPDRTAEMIAYILYDKRYCTLT